MLTDRYQILKLEIYKNGRFVKRDKLKVPMTKDFKTMEWGVSREAIQKAIQDNYPYLCSQKNVEFVLS